MVRQVTTETNTPQTPPTAADIAAMTEGQLSDKSVALDRTPDLDSTFKTMAMRASVGMYVVQDDKFCFVNRQFMQETGFTWEELAQMHPSSLVFDDDRRIVRENAIAMLKGRRTEAFEHRAVVKGGGVRWVLETVTSITYQGRPASLGNYMDITERKKMEEKLARYRARLKTLLKERTSELEAVRHSAITDSLTGLFNHRHLQERLSEQIERCSGYGDIFSLILLDVDHLKAQNDTHGHVVGDELLRLVGRIIPRSVRASDIGFRHGGDEFAVILPGTFQEGAFGVAERVRTDVQAESRVAGKLITCSLGVASWPTDGVTLGEIMGAADAALYDAKRAGRNHTSLACEVIRSGAPEAAEGRSPRRYEAILDTVFSLASKVDARDPRTIRHSAAVSEYAVGIATALGYSRIDVDRIRRAGLLHDIGKVCISHEVFAKDEPLVTEDWEMIWAHTNLGVAVLRQVDGLQDCLAAAQHHHERYDGAGYPAGLKGEDIPLDARILAIADSYDAMVSDRPYRAALSREAALQELIYGAGTAYDPSVVDAFLSSLRARLTRSL
jgi:diguanylate cyclase (GGDEF)-like protein/PAS domain S-box-containing protein/putative nucleotidyltransferase with HDIG domain